MYLLLLNAVASAINSYKYFKDYSCLIYFLYKIVFLIKFDLFYYYFVFL